VHHYGKTVSNGIRGASNWRAMADHAIYVTGDREEAEGTVKNRKVVIGKNRIGPEGPQFCFELEEQKVGINLYGEPRTTCTVLRTDEDPTKVPVKESTFDEAYQQILKTEMTVWVDETQSRGVREDDLRNEFIKRYPLESGNKKSLQKAWQRNVTDECPKNYCRNNGIISKRTVPINEFQPVQFSAFRQENAKLH